MAHTGRPLFERAEYLVLTIHRDKEVAELQFARPNGTPISVTIPLAQLSDLLEDIGQKYPEALKPVVRVSKKKKKKP